MLGSRKFLGMGGFTSKEALAGFGGGSNSGIQSMGVGYEMSLGANDPSGHFDGSVRPAEDTDISTVNFLTAGRTLTIDVLSASVSYVSNQDDGPFGGLYDQDQGKIKVQIFYARMANVFNEPAPNLVENHITLTSTAPPSFVVVGGNRIYTNNFETYNVSIQELAYNQNNQSSYPIRWITRKRIPTTDKSLSTGPNTGKGLIGVYNVVSRGTGTSGNIQIRVREGAY